jgi:hypothetical protein
MWQAPSTPRVGLLAPTNYLGSGPAVAELVFSRFRRGFLDIPVRGNRATVRRVLREPG